MDTRSSLFGKPDRGAHPLSSVGLRVADFGTDADFNLSATQVANATLGAAMDGGSKLIVGPNIKLKGVEITDCDTLVVEGSVEATMAARVMQIDEQGAFKGSAVIDLVTIRGRFDGALTVRQVLVVHATGKVTGQIRYNRILIEEGGQLSGEIRFEESAA